VVHLTSLPTPVGPSRWAMPVGDIADDDGIVGVGADLAPATLVEAYRRGIFPWPHDDMPLPWFCPDPRALIDVDGIHRSRSLRRTLRRCGWTATVDAAFDDVVRACGEDRAEGTWIDERLRRAYGALHDLGWAHSVEVWEGDALVGGIYGVLVGRVFTGESMFHRRDDASKVAMVELCARLAEQGGRWLDCQLLTPHLAAMGAWTEPREAFLERLAGVRDDLVRLATDERPVSRLAG
jgi:leucyl/phenylalanyl-tRNA--protein transferase